MTPVGQATITDAVYVAPQRAGRRIGSSLRVRGVQDWLGDLGVSCDALDIVVPRVATTRSYHALADEIAGTADGRFVILGALSAPYMLALAPRLDRLGIPVVIDVCDNPGENSRVLWSESRVRGIAASLLWRRGTRALPLSMVLLTISVRDAVLTRSAMPGHTVRVVPPIAPSGLAISASEPFLRPRRIAIPVDLEAPHTRVGAELVFETLESMRPLPLPVVLYGPTAPPGSLLDRTGATYGGYPESLIQVYSPGTIVIVVNTQAGGVSHKAWEGMLAGCVVVASDAVLRSLPPYPRAQSFADAGSIVAAIRSAVKFHSPGPIPSVDKVVRELWAADLFTAADLGTLSQGPVKDDSGI